MLLIAQIILVVFNWMVGYRGYALLPLAIPVGAALLAAARGSFGMEAQLATMMLDALSIIILSIMLGKKALHYKRLSEGQQTTGAS